MGSTGAGGAGAVRGTTLKEKKLEGGAPPPRCIADNDDGGNLKKKLEEGWGARCGDTGALQL